MIGGEGNDNTIHSTLHWGPWVDGGHPNYGESYTLPSGIFADDFHIIETEWNESFVKTYCDGTLFYTIDISAQGLEAFHAPFFIIINLAVGGNWPGSPDATTIFPQEFQIDYIRLYQTEDMIILDTPVEKSGDDLAYVYPNPFYDSITIESAKSISDIEIMDYTGRILIAAKSEGSIHYQFQTNNLPAGMYMIRINYEDRNSELIKVVK
jgi:beta-glucanase (GH16 family)